MSMIYGTLSFGAHHPYTRVAPIAVAALTAGVMRDTTAIEFDRSRRRAISRQRAWQQPRPLSPTARGAMELRDWGSVMRPIVLVFLAAVSFLLAATIASRQGAPWAHDICEVGRTSL